LTRIFRTTDANGNPVYSDQPLADTGRPVETQYRGAQGFRADADFNPTTGRDVVHGDPGRTVEGGRSQLRALGRQLADSQGVREGQDPTNPRGLEFTQTEGGPRVTTAEERALAAGSRGRGGAGGGLSSSDQIALLRLQEQIGSNRATQTDRQRGLARQEQADLRRFARDDPQAFLRENLGQLRGLSTEELDDYFTTPEGRFTQSLIDDALSTTYQKEGAAFLGGPFQDSPQGLGDLEEAPWYSGTPLDLFRGQRYVTPGDRLQRGVTLDDLGLPPGDSWLLDYFARRNASQE
jgi:hypothetical protein